MHLTTKNTFVFILIISFFSAFGQPLIKGKVQDSDNGTFLSSVQIINIETKAITISNSKGVFEVIKTGRYSFNKDGYHEKVVDLERNTYYNVQLQINTSQLNEIIIRANYIQKKLKRATATIDIISTSDIKRGNSINMASIFNRLPGVFMQSGTLNTNRITIRGIGARNLYGTAKIRAYFKDIPLTNGSGETTIEDFELNTMSRFEIIKGAISSIYGAGLGGAIHITPQTAFFNQSSVNTQLSVGSFGLIKGTVNANYGSTTNGIRAVYSNTHSDGYRENNTYDRQTLTINSNHTLGEKDKLSFLGSYVDLKGYIPSSVNEDTFKNRPKSAAFTWQEAQGFEDTKRAILGLSWSHEYNSSVEQYTSVFTSFRDTYEPRPFDVLSENSFALGLRSRILGKTKLFSKELHWTLGTEIFKERYITGIFENLYADFPSGTGSVKGNRESDFKEKRTYYNLFFEVNHEVSEKTTLSLGFNFNKTRYNLKDRYVVSGDNPDQSGRYQFKGILSPTMGISHLLSKKISLYANISHGFSPVTLKETLLPDGQINTNLKPETGWNFEIGTRGALMQDRLYLNVALYSLNIKNLLVSRRTAEDQYIGINAGKTQHNGLEMALSYEWIKQKSMSLNTFVSYTYNNFMFKEFSDGDNNFSGNDLTGVPSNVFNTGIDIDSQFGIYGNINFQHVGSMPITDSNSLFSDSYNITNLKTGYKMDLSKTFSFSIFLGINNIFDKTYASQILINASGFGGRAPRYYYPAQPVSYYSGINISYIF